MKSLDDRRDVDKDFLELMQEASFLYEQENLKCGDVDEVFIRQLLKRKKQANIKKALRSVAVITLVLITGVSVSVWTQVDGVYGGKQFVEKCISLISPINSEEEINEDGDVTNVITITDEADLSLAKRTFEKLKHATYIPEGYVFDSLKIQKGTDFETVEYRYVKGEQSLLIVFQYEEEMSEIMVVGEIYKSPQSGKQFYIDEIEETKEYSIIDVTETYECIVMGIGDKQEGIKVIESIDNF